MQVDLSMIREGTPLALRHAAAARPEGPAPTITGPGTQTQRLENLMRLVLW